MKLSELFSIISITYGIKISTPTTLDIAHKAPASAAKNHFFFFIRYHDNTVVNKNKLSVITLPKKKENGAIIPKDEELVKILSNNRIIISISQYSNVNREPLIAFLKDKKINYRIDKMNFWMEYGNIEKRNKSLKELKKQFKKCNHICKSLLKGNLHMCPRSSHGTDLGIINDNAKDYVNLLDTNITIDEKKKLINELLNKKYIIACDYCDFATNKCKKIPVAEQFLVRPDVASRA